MNLTVPVPRLHQWRMRGGSDLGGIVSMLAATAVFVVGDTSMKIVTEDLPPFEVLFLRAIAASIACAAIVSVRGEWRAIAGMLDRRALLRAAAETAGTLCYVVALARLPIADVIAILQTAPLILILGTAILLRERVGPLRVVLVLTGFAGALMVAQPGGNFSFAALLVFGSALFIAARDLIVRGVPVSIPAAVVIFATMVMAVPAAAIMSLAFETWTPPGLHHLSLLGLSGLCLATGHIGLILAYRLGRTASVAPFFYSFALWGVVAGVVVWGDLPNLLALAGIVLIVASGIAIVLLDQRRGRAGVQLSEAL